MKQILFNLVFFLVSIPSFSMEIKGISILEKQNYLGQQLILNGVGIRQKAFIDLYIGSLYMPTFSNNAHDIINMENIVVIKLDIISKLVGSTQLNKAIETGFKSVATTEQLKLLSYDIGVLRQVLSEEKIVVGDILEFIAQKSRVTVLKNRKELVIFDNELFKKSLLSIWLGEKPADLNLKMKMLSLDK